MFKYLRIAVTAFSLTACALFVALWVRSYWRHDAVVRIQSSRALGVTSGQGRISLYAQQLGVDDQWHFASSPIETPAESQIFPNWRWYNRYPSYIGIAIPHWLLIVLSPLFSAIVWVKWSRRFSMRAILSITTITAVLVALFAFAFRK